MLNTRTVPVILGRGWEGSVFTCMMGSKVTVTHGEGGAGVAKLRFCRGGVARGGVDPGLSGW